MVQDAVFGTEEDSRPTERQVPAVYERKSADKQECSKRHLQIDALKRRLSVHDRMMKKFQIKQDELQIQTFTATTLSFICWD